MRILADWEIKDFQKFKYFVNSGVLSSELKSTINPSPAINNILKGLPPTDRLTGCLFVIVLNYKRRPYI